jgi:DNA-binding GntR family transcriptional regulator
MKVEFDEADNQNLSLRGRVFTQIQNDILNGYYKPGDSLIETKLSEQLGVSRTPIREALRQLELEGLVYSVPNKGVVVKGISSKDIEDIYAIRMRIEGLAARWAAEKITDEELEELKQAVELEGFYTKKHNLDQLLQFDSKFHEIIYRACKSKPLTHTLSSFHNFIQRARFLSMNTPGRAKLALNEHKAILRALMERNADLAEKLAVEHVRNASLNLFNQKENQGLELL